MCLRLAAGSTGSGCGDLFVLVIIWKLAGFWFFSFVGSICFACVACRYCFDDGLVVWVVSVG